MNMALLRNVWMNGSAVALQDMK